MALKDDRTSETYRIPRIGVIHEGVHPRKAPPKAWPSDKPPGGNLPKPAPKADKKS